MINYYKSGFSFYRIDTDSKSFYHANDAEDVSFFGLITKEITFDQLLKAITDNTTGRWLVASEEEFLSAKENVLNKLK